MWWMRFASAERGWPWTYTDTQTHIIQHVPCVIHWIHTKSRSLCACAVARGGDKEGRERDTGFALRALHACCAQKHACKTQDAPDLRVRDTTVEPRLRVRLVLAVAVASGGTATHGANRLGRPNQTDETMVA